MNCGIKRIIQLKNAVQYSKVAVFDDNKDITLQCSYSWSVDGVCWTSWTDYDNYLNICKNLESDFYLRILLRSGFTKIYINNCCDIEYNVCIDSSSTFLTDFCGETNLFQPYNNLDCALQLQQQLSDSVVCMFGIPIYYIKVDPDVETADYTFKDYVLYHVDSIKQLKLMISDGQMPSSNPKLNEFEFDWEIDWETELSKSQFAKAFGDTAFPKSGDFIYIPLMKRMWNVNSAYDEKNEGLMWRSTTWKLALTKYTESTNVDTGNFEDIIDNWIINTYDNVFGELESNQIERETGSSQVQSPIHAATNLYNIFMEDAVRKQYTKNDIIINDKTYNHRSNVVSRNIYNFKKENGCIVYQHKICGDQGTLMFILDTPGSIKDELNRCILEFGEIRLNVKYNNPHILLEFDGMECKLDTFKSYLVTLKWDRNTFIKEMNVYNYTHNQNIPVYKLKPEMYWFDFENPVYKNVGNYNNDFHMRQPKECRLHAYPLTLTNIKLYNKYLLEEETIKESVKYSTQHNNCVISDLARPIDSGHGYVIK